MPSEALLKINEAITKGTLTPENPLILDGNEIDGLKYDVAARLRDLGKCEDGQIEYPNGLILTFHRSVLPKSECLDTIWVRDEAGVAYPALNPDQLLVEPGFPIPEEVIDHVQVRVAACRMGIPLPADYETFKKLEAGGELGFGHLELGMIRPDAMVVATCTDGEWTNSQAVPYSNLSVSPNNQAWHYGSAEFEGMTCEIGDDNFVNIFGMEQHYERMGKGSVRLGMDPVPRDLFEESVIQAVQQNARFIPENGRLYVRPHCADIGPQMKVGNSRVTGFFVEVTPIGAYFKKHEAREDGSDVKMKVLGIPDNRVRAADHGGEVKAAGNYAQTAPVIGAITGLNVSGDEENPNHPDGVLYLDRVVEGLKEEELREARICETNASNAFFIEDLGDGRYRIVFPTLDHGDILPGHTRALIIKIAEKFGWEVEERDVLVGEVMDEDFCAGVHCGTAGSLTPFDAIHLAHIEETYVKKEDDEKEVGVSAELRGELILIRSQEEVNANPMPAPAQRLLDAVLDTKAGRTGEADKEKYLTRVPFLKRKGV